MPLIPISHHLCLRLSLFSASDHSRRLESIIMSASTMLPRCRRFSSSAMRSAVNACQYHDHYRSTPVGTLVRRSTSSKRPNRQPHRTITRPLSDSQHTSPAQQLNPHALDSAQDPTERFEVMQPPPSGAAPAFDPRRDRPVSAGACAARAHVHRRGLWHNTVHVWLVSPATSAVLLQKRSATKDTFPGRWDISSAGHVAAGASLAATARAELAEELGAGDVADAELTVAFVVPAAQAAAGGCNAYEHVYFLTRGEDAPFALGTAEVSEVRWAPVKEVLRALRRKDEGYAIRTTQYVDLMEQELAKILGDKILQD